MRRILETVVNRCFLAAVLTPLLLLLPAVRAQAQWVPKGALAAVPVVQDCDETGGDVAVSQLDPPAVYLCPIVVKLIRKKNPGAEHFFFVHEFGHVAQDTSNEAAADCWAAKELAKAPNGSRYLIAVIELLRQRPNEYSPRYGTPSERAERIRSCAEEERVKGLAANPDAPKAMISLAEAPGCRGGMIARDPIRHLEQPCSSSASGPATPIATTTT